MQKVLQYEQESFLNEIWFERRKAHAKKKNHEVDITKCH